MYDYKNGRKRIEEILKKETNIITSPYLPDDNNKLTYDNAYKTWVGSIFIDIKGSSKLFIKKDEGLVRIMRAFTHECITILEELPLYKEIGIRGDSVYAIYDIAKRADLLAIFQLAVTLNSFLSMFNKIIAKHGMDELIAGIGLGADEDLVIKAGKKSSRIEDRIWIGRAVVDASNLADLANRNGLMPICISKSFYEAIRDDLIAKNEGFRYFISYNEKLDMYECDIYYNEIDKWIREGMSDGE